MSEGGSGGLRGRLGRWLRGWADALDPRGPAAEDAAAPPLPGPTAPSAPPAPALPGPVAPGSDAVTVPAPTGDTGPLLPSGDGGPTGGSALPTPPSGSTGGRTGSSSAGRTPVTGAGRLRSRMGAVGSLVQGDEERYVRLHEIGRGGMGRVLEVVDRNTRRRVAMKVLPLSQPDRTRDQFVHEAQITAQLEHPSIVPTYDLGLTRVEGDRALFYTMKRIRGTRLSDRITAHHRKRERDPLERRQLLRALASVSLAIEYAHSRGVLHRDLKPDNVMLGDFGEVLVLDWGIARVDPERENGIRTILTEVGQGSRVGGIAGTPGYIPPEVLDEGPLGPHTDVYALGVMLYLVLCGQRPFEGRNAMSVLLQATREAPRAPREVRPDVPVALSDLALRALERDWRARIPTARGLYDALTTLLDRAEDDDRREAAARRFTEAGYAHAATALARVRAHRRLLEPVGAPGRAGPEQALAVQREGLVAFAAAEAAFHKALEFDPSHARARRGLADLLRDRLLHEEELGTARPADLEVLEARLAEVDDGRYRSVVSGEGTLRVDTEPPGAELVLRRLADRGGVRVPEGDEIALGTSPTFRASVPRGTWRLEARLPGRAPARLDLRVGRNRDLDARLRLFRPEEIGEGFVAVPGGPFLAGGDDRATGSWPARLVDVPTFFVARHPVTVAEWRAFVEDAGPGEAPRPRGVGGFGARDDDRPVVGISAGDAEAYCAWWSARFRRAVQLPTEVQWEKAARGADGRVFPWGDGEQPEPGGSDPLPVGTCAHDESPWGARDLATNVLEWCADPLADGLRAVRGGSRLLGGGPGRVAARRAFPAGDARPDLGFRLVSAVSAPRGEGGAA